MSELPTTDLTEFWLGRFAKHGHTGWADWKTYTFDQPCRLQRFREWLDSSGMKPGKALDFGCGTGDFSRLLVSRGWSVVAYDRYISPLFSHARLTPTRSLQQVEDAGPYDLVISITVLDGILEDADFAARLKDIRSFLAPQGRYYLLEYACDTPKPRSEYQGFRLLSDWRSELAKAGLVLTSVEPYFHPYEASIPASKLYDKMFVVRVMIRLAKMGIPAACFASILDHIARRCLLACPYARPAASPIKIMIGRRRSESDFSDLELDSDHEKAGAPSTFLDHLPGSRLPKPAHPRERRFAEALPLVR